MRPPNALTTRSVVSCHDPPDRTARRIAAVSGSGHVPATLGSSATERDIAPPGSLPTTVTTGITSAQIPVCYGSIGPIYESARGSLCFVPLPATAGPTPAGTAQRCHVASIMSIITTYLLGNIRASFRSSHGAGGTPSPGRPGPRLGDHREDRGGYAGGLALGGCDADISESWARPGATAHVPAWRGLSCACGIALIMERN